eukprot:5955456-Pleurochrysis_carterae.AAC.7
MEGYALYPPRPDRMYPIGSVRGAGCHDNGDHDLYGAPPHIKIRSSTGSSRLCNCNARLTHIKLQFKQLVDPNNKILAMLKCQQFQPHEHRRTIAGVQQPKAM